MADNSAPGFTKHPDHKITTAPSPEPAEVIRGGKKLADSQKALVLKEGAYPAVIYFPRQDVAMSLLDPMEETTYCPFKGHASYWAYKGQKVAWSYDAPYDEMAVIRGYLAFYPEN